jgi:hypothetical protein
MIPDTSTITIRPNDVFTRYRLSQVLGVGESTIDKARRSGALRYTRKGSRTLFLGSWVLAWLMAGDNQGAPCAS